MKTEEQIKDFLARCNEVKDWGMSKGSCPAEEDGAEGCCAECSTPATLHWVLNDNKKPSNNMQNELIEVFKTLE